ncbi:MAG: ribosomal L7Ae/L30e/S12e/Gadd45 family protein [Lachnospiraceae bacterium]|nr:ribosomal L7Ae/L30e/S12e/Gadd45 family protein [Lachnospiraceae bacterium]
MKNKILSLISLATKAGKIVSGEFAVEKAVKEEKALLVIVSVDASKRSKKMYTDMCSFYKVPLYFYGNKDELGRYTGKEFRVSVAVLDSGFRDALIKQMDLDSKEI